ncbi:MAG: cytochrome o ubiquinol oxidase subunit IV, partial [Pseudoalteromonas sp.]
MSHSETHALKQAQSDHHDESHGSVKTYLIGFV